MGIRTPDFWFDKLTDITPEFFLTNHITWAAVDMDNTLTLPNTPQLLPEASLWVEKMRRSGVTLVLVSNNKCARVQPVAEAAGLPYIWRACKPFAFGINRAARLAGQPKAAGAFIGDQLFTDIEAARRARVTAILVDPLVEDREKFVSFKRRLEKKHHEANLVIKEQTRALSGELSAANPQNNSAASEIEKRTD